MWFWGLIHTVKQLTADGRQYAADGRQYARMTADGKYITQPGAPHKEGPADIRNPISAPAQDV